MSKLFTILLLSSFSLNAVAQFPPPRLPQPDFIPERVQLPIPPQVRPPTIEEIRRKVRETEIPGTTKRTRQVVVIVDDTEPQILQQKKKAETATEQTASARIAKEIATEIAKANLESLHFGSLAGKASDAFADGLVQILLEVNADGRLLSLVVQKHPKNPGKRKFSEVAVAMIQKFTNFEVKPQAQSTIVELKFYFNAAGKFKIIPEGQTLQ